MRHTLRTVSETAVFDDIRLRNGWAENYLEGDAFYAFLTQQEAQIRSLMQSIGYLR
jgi:tripartite-type tricarboxylate transporter receptor subunit TctC